jgi:hypothetical protein
MRRFICLAVIGSFVAPTAWAQGDKASSPNGAPLKTMERARSYAVTNRSDETIIATHARMTTGDELDLVWNEPLRPRQGRNIAVPSRDCLAQLTVKFQSGRTMKSGSPDCRETRIIVTNNALQIGNSASDRSPIE